MPATKKKPRYLLDSRVSFADLGWLMGSQAANPEFRKTVIDKGLPNVALSIVAQLCGTVCGTVQSQAASEQAGPATGLQGPLVETLK